MISNSQIRAARVLLGWKQTDLATAAKLSEMSVKNVERGVTDSRMSTITAIQTALEAAGVTFLSYGEVAGGPGVSLRAEV